MIDIIEHLVDLKIKADGSITSANLAVMFPSIFKPVKNNIVFKNRNDVMKYIKNYLSDNKIILLKKKSHVRIKDFDDVDRVIQYWDLNYYLGMAVKCIFNGNTENNISDFKLAADYIQKYIDYLNDNGL